MIKYSISALLATIIVLCYSCNTQPKSDKEVSTEPLTAVSIPVEEEVTSPASTTTYETIILEADLPSPRKEMTGHIGDINIKVNYGSPSVKGRDVWGALVPFGKVWRTGANEATTFTIDQIIRINGKELLAGTYGLFTLPTEDSWEIIFNKTAEQWGAYEYDDAEDVLRVSASPKKTESISEMVEFVIEGDQLVILWEKLSVPFTISTI